MPARPLTPPSTDLGVAIRTRRGSETQKAAAIQVGIGPSTFSRLEAGVQTPSSYSARRLARWLGWTVEAVLDAAEKVAAQRSQEGA